ncbi:MAG: hypothetical protein I8H75_05800 [Myxococcaceae bacterium]|nr:hypothetical protein [Myxococcaceae bacterium]MBH2006830.1 hypothetical protein [Myxococcaceae bacterium]
MGLTIGLCGRSTGITTRTHAASLASTVCATPAQIMALRSRQSRFKSSCAGNICTFPELYWQVNWLRLMLEQAFLL